MRTKILIIDRDETAVQELRAAFELHGAEVHITSDGEAGVSLAERESPALIVLAIELPTTSGYSICKKIKRHQALGNIPLFITSSTATPDIFEQHKRLKTRAEEYFFKPIAIDELIQTAQNYVPIGGETTFIVDPSTEADLIEVSDDLILGEDADVIVVDDDPLDDEPTRVVDASEMRADVFSQATEAEIDSAIGELTGALGGSGDFQIAIAPPDEDEIVDDDEIEILDFDGEEPSVEIAAPEAKVAEAEVEIDVVDAPFAESAATDAVRAVPTEDYEANVSSSHADVIQQLRAEIDRLNGMLRGQDEQMAALRTSSSSSKREYHALREEVHAKRIEGIELEDKVYSKERDLDTLRDAEDALRAKAAHAERETATLRAELATVGAATEETQEKLDEAISAAARVANAKQAAEAKIVQLESQGRDLTKTVEELQGQVDALQTALDQKTASLSEAENAKATLQASAESLHSAVAAAEQAAETARTEGAASVAAAKREADEAVAAAQTRADQAVETALSDAKSAVEAAVNEAKQAVESAQEETKRAVETAENEKTEAIEAAQAASTKALEEAKADAKRRIDEAEASAAAQVEAAKTEAESSLQSVRDESSLRLQEVEEAAREREETLTAEHAAAIEALGAAHTEALGALRSELQESHNAELGAKDVALDALQSDKEQAVRRADEATERLAGVERKLEAAETSASLQATELEEANGRLVELESERNILSAGLQEHTARADGLATQLDELTRQHDDMSQVLDQTTRAQSRLEELTRNMRSALEQVGLLAHSALEQADGADSEDADVLELSAAEVDEAGLVEEVDDSPPPPPRMPPIPTGQYPVPEDSSDTLEAVEELVSAEELDFDVDVEDDFDSAPSN